MKRALIKGTTGGQKASTWVSSCSTRAMRWAWATTAALAGTMAANFVYPTMQFYYFYAFAVFVLALPILFGRRVTR